MQGKSRRWLWVGISTICIVLIAGVVMGLMWSKSHQKTWTPYASSAGKFKVLFCGQAKESSRSAGGGLNIETDYMTSATSPDGVYMGVTWTDFPPEAFRTSKPEEVVDSKALSGATFGAMISQDKGMRKGLYTHEIEYQSNFDGLLNRQMVVVKGQRVYTVFGSGAKTENVRKDLQTFFDSFDVTE